MRAVTWACRSLIFLFMLAFAIKNTDTVNVRFILDTSWQAPLIIVLLVVFAAGASLGVLSLLGTVFGLRREITQLRRLATKNESAQNEKAPDLPAPSHDAGL
jgi:putative membrane protein